MKKFKYILIYSVSFLLVFLIWYRAILIENRLDKVNEIRIEESDELVEESDEGNAVFESDSLVIVRPTPPRPIEYVESPKSVFDYINEILTTIIGLINIITFVYQMKDRRRSEQTN